MLNQPLETSLAIGSGCALFVLGFMAWWRKRSATGNVLYALMAFSFAVWTLTDWFLGFSVSSLPSTVLWKLIFYAAVFCGPSLIMHGTNYLSLRPLRRENLLAYLASLFSFGFSVLALLAADRFLGLTAFPSYFCLQVAAGLGLVMYVISLLCLAFYLYPQTVSPSATFLEKRRTAYGILVLAMFGIAGILQLVIGPIPVAALMPFLAAAFLTLSLMAFVRTAFLEVDLSPLQAFVVFLVAYGVLMLLRAEDEIEALVMLGGAVMVGVFAAMAIRTVRGERTKRLFLEDANRQLRMLEEAKSDFVDMVAHQLRGPLGGIRAASSMLANGDYGPLPEKAAKMSDQILNTASRLLSLSDTFLNASRLEVGAYRSTRVPTDIRKEVDDIFREVSIQAEAKGIQLITDVGVGCPRIVSMDHEVLENVLFNLVDNAIKYTAHGSVTVSCRHGAGQIIFDVTDTGQGMSPDECRDLFKKFHRGKLGRMHQSDGTGLGLYIVKQLVEAAGGTIGVSCAGPEKGTTFTAQLPFDEIKDA